MCCEIEVCAQCGKNEVIILFNKESETSLGGDGARLYSQEAEEVDL